MNPTKTRINRIGTILSVICTVAEAVLAVFMVISGVGACAIAYRGEYEGIFREFYETNTVYRILNSLADLRQMDSRYASAIGCAIAFLTFLVLFLFLKGFRRLLKELIESEHPFSIELAKEIRRSSYVLLLSILYNPIIGAALFLLALLFSYLVEYGAYLQIKADQTNRIQEEMIVSFAEITENKSGQTGQHIRRVSEYTKALAKELGMTEEESENLRLASTMHDLGKLLIPSEILDKPGRLTDEEFAVIRKHPSYGGQLLENVEGDVMELAREVALEHHERIDGKGYPTGKTGEDISLPGRIVAVADVYDALTSRRSYKEAWDEDRAYEEIVKNAGSQFDADVVKAFQSCYPKIQEIRRKFADSAPSASDTTN